MQWRTITNGLGNTAYSLWSNGSRLLTLAFKGQPDGAYIELEDGEKRYFKYRKKGIFNRKIILENEYGTGLSILGKDGERDYVLIDNIRYYLNFIDKENVEIKADDVETPLAVCSLQVDDPSATAKTGLLMVLCYYLIGHPQKREVPLLTV